MYILVTQINEKKKNIGLYALVFGWMEACLNLQLIVKNWQVYVVKMIEEVCFTERSGLAFSISIKN